MKGQRVLGQRVTEVKKSKRKVETRFRYSKQKSRSQRKYYRQKSAREFAGTFFPSDLFLDFRDIRTSI